MSMVAPRGLKLAASYAALVDILLATMGIFVVVFTQLHLEDTPRLVPLEVDGLILCQGAGRVEVFDAVQADIRNTASTVAQLSQTIQAVWPTGARLMVALTADCAWSDAARNVWALETDIRRIETSGARYLVELVPLSSAPQGPGSFEALFARWKQGIFAGETE